MKQYENVYTLNMDTINSIFSILFFIDNSQSLTKSFMPDNSKRTI